MTFKPIICIDFDGVLHSYASGWQGADVANDPPVQGAIEWLRGLIRGDEVVPQIYSSRSKDPAGLGCMRRWLKQHGLADEDIYALQFPIEKPAAFLTIDDRALCFEGVFPTVEAMKGFVPWNKRGDAVQALKQFAHPAARAKSVLSAEEWAVLKEALQDRGPLSDKNARLSAMGYQSLHPDVPAESVVWPAHLIAALRKLALCELGRYEPPLPSTGLDIIPM